MRRCNIPAKTLPPCDLEWGHDGDQHSNEGDGFYAREHDDDHHRRQRAVRKEAKKLAKRWTRVDAFAFVSSIRPALLASGHCLALTGSLLFEESSEHDLDLVIYPMDSSVDRTEAARAALVESGLRLAFDRSFVTNNWRKRGSSDEKCVDVWQMMDGRHIDIFWLR